MRAKRQPRGDEASVGDSALVEPAARRQRRPPDRRARAAGRDRPPRRGIRPLPRRDRSAAARRLRLRRSGAPGGLQPPLRRTLSARSGAPETRRHLARDRRPAPRGGDLAAGGRRLSRASRADAARRAVARMARQIVGRPDDRGPAAGASRRRLDFDSRGRHRIARPARRVRRARFAADADRLPPRQPVGQGRREPFRGLQQGHGDANGPIRTRRYDRQERPRAAAAGHRAEVLRRRAEDHPQRPADDRHRGIRLRRFGRQDLAADDQGAGAQRAWRRLRRRWRLARHHRPPSIQFAARRPGADPRNDRDERAARRRSSTRWRG